MPSTINILLIDDDKDEHIFFQEALNKITTFKCRLRSRYDGQSAIDFLLGNEKNTDEPIPDIIFLDLNMPRMDGFSTLKAIKAEREFKETPVYIFTNSRNMEDVKITNKLGSFGYFTKSIDQKMLKHQLEDILGAISLTLQKK